MKRKRKRKPQTNYSGAILVLLVFVLGGFALYFGIPAIDHMF